MGQLRETSLSFRNLNNNTDDNNYGNSVECVLQTLNLTAFQFVETAFYLVIYVFRLTPFICLKVTRDINPIQQIFGAKTTDLKTSVNSISIFRSRDICIICMCTLA